jgi:uncharacterized protein DUF5916
MRLLTSATTFMPSSTDRVTHRTLLFVCLIAIGWAHPAAANGERDDRAKQIRAVRTASPPRIDGRIDDAEWALATVDDRFTQRFPNDGDAPSERTELRVLYDDEALYIAVRCWDRTPAAIEPRLTRRDRETDSDKVQIDISSKNDRLSAFHFDVNVSGVKVDGFRFNDTDYNPDWDDLMWDAATSRDDRGWSAELLIPLRSLRYDGRESRFGLQARRIIQRRGETDEWAHISRTVSGEVSYYGSLVGIEGLRARRLFLLLPYVTAKLSILNNQPPLGGLYPSWGIGTDLKLGITPGLILDATFNPDYGQIEADQVILNLTTFETFYPEKRPFFLEGAEFFNTPFQQFYSRRIGQGAPDPVLSGSDQRLEPLPNTQILGAVKLTGQLTPRTNVAALAALTSRIDTVVGTFDHRRELELAPYTSFAVLRLRQDFGRNSYVGLTSTAVNRFENDGSDLVTGMCPDGDVPGARGRCSRDAYTTGLDLNLRTANGTWGASGHAVGSWLVNGPTRLLPDGTALGPGSTGAGFYVEAGKYGGEHWLARLSYLGATPMLSLDDAGYLRQSNLHQARGVLTWRTTHPVGPLLETELHIALTYAQSWDGAQLLRHSELVWSTRWKSFWETYFECDYDLDHDDNREARDGTRVGRIGASGCDAEVRTDSRRRVVVQLGVWMLRSWHGLELSSYSSLRLRPIPSIELDVLPNLQWSYGDPRWFDTVDDGNGNKSYYFGELDSREFDVTVRGTYTFTPRLSLQIYGQIFIASGHYGPIYSATPTAGPHPSLPLSALTPSALPMGAAPDFREGVLNLNVVFRWEFHPGSTLLFVYSHTSQQTPFDPSLEPVGNWTFGRFAGGSYSDVLQVKATFLLN